MIKVEEGDEVDRSELETVQAFRLTLPCKEREKIEIGDFASSFSLSGRREFHGGMGYHESHCKVAMHLSSRGIWGENEKDGKYVGAGKHVPISGDI